MKSSPTRLSRLSALLLLAPTGYALAQDTAPADAKAKEILASVTGFLAKADALSVDAVLKIEQTMPESVGGGTQKTELIQTLSLNRPGRFSLVTKGDSGMTASAYATDGRLTIVLDRDTIIAAPFEGELGGIFKNERFGYDADSDSTPLLDQNTGATFLRGMIFDSKENPWDKNVTGMKYEGEEEIDGQKTHKLTVTSRQEAGPGGKPLEIDVALWISAGEQPLPLRIVPDTSTIIAAMSEDNPAFEGMKVSIAGTFEHWAIGKVPADSAFQPDHNADADKYDDFAGFLAAMNEQNGGEGGDPTTLVGQEAPDFEIAMLDGSTFKLSELKGQKTVILDFWATWCGPCVMALPILQEVAHDFADKDVLLVAVNQGEENEEISAFLKEKMWDGLKVALDKEGVVAGSYLVEGIPQTVIVGKDGKIKKVHVGFAPDLAETLATELKEIMAE